VAVLPVADAVTVALSLLLVVLAWRELAGAAAVTRRALILGGLAVGALTALFAVLLDAVRAGDGVTALDEAGLEWALQRRTDELTAVVQVATEVGSMLFLAVVVLVAGPLLARRDGSRLPFGVLAATAAMAGLVSSVGKVVVGRERPPADVRLVVEESASFPSGHSLSAMAVYVVLAWLVGRGLGSAAARAGLLAGFVALAVGVGVSRVYLGVHWVTDVLASWLLAWILILVVVTATTHALTRRARRLRRPPAPRAPTGGPATTRVSRPSRAPPARDRRGPSPSSSHGRPTRP
jgi:undecaprenyl-diphosphatase